MSQASRGRNGDAGNDFLNGRRGDDLFVFRDGDGADRISIFNAGAGTEDVIDLTGTSAVSDFSELQGIASQVGAGTVMDFDGGDSITLLGVDVNDLTRTISSFCSVPVNREGTNGTSNANDTRDINILQTNAR